MKSISLSLLAAALLALTACTNDPELDRAIGESLDAANQILQVVIQGVETFSR